MYEIQVSAAAKKDLRKIYLWYENQQKGLGERFIVEFSVLTSNLEQNPLSFPVVFKDKRKQVFPTFPYCIYFKMKDETIRLLAVVHGKRNPKVWRKR